MRIGLLSDTHIPEVTSCLPRGVTEAFKGVELILHAGDIFSPEVLDELEKIAPVFCSRGDDDYYRKADSRIKDVHNLTFEGVSTGLVHDLPYPDLSQHSNPSWKKEESWRKLESAIKQRLGLLPKIIVFGHTHQPLIKEYKGIYFINPGSATFPGYKNKPGTVAILEVTPALIKAEIMKLD